MDYVYFLSPLMMPAECQAPQPMLYYPVKPAMYRFPIPVWYSEPPIAVL
ncbi:MAG: hypothetical protein ACLP5V_10345 [Candidatus Bathyarchaeia archaeon]